MLLLLVILVSILLVQGTRKIPVQFAKRVVGNRQFGGVRQFIPGDGGGGVGRWDELRRGGSQ